jgi:hypothetical protein
MKLLYSVNVNADHFTRIMKAFSKKTLKNKFIFDVVQQSYNSYLVKVYHEL